jgi:TfoX/Sxy family transcriptional regulator of competence genes
MAYDEKLADRIRRTVGPRDDVTEKTMFGGLAFLLNGKMFCGIVGSDLMVRVGRERYEAALRKAHTRPMDFTGKPLPGYVYVSEAGCRGVSLAKWIDQGAANVAAMPRKQTRRKDST